MPPVHLLGHMFFMGLMVAALVAAVASARRRRKGWMPRHRALAISGAVSGLVGALAMAVVKYVRGWPHLATPHSRVGAVALALVLTAPILALLMLAGAAKLRLPHRLAGAMAMLAALAAGALGVATAFA